METSHIMEFRNIDRQTNIKMFNKAIKSLLLRAKNLSSAEVKVLESLLHKEKLLGLKVTARDL